MLIYRCEDMRVNVACCEYLSLCLGDDGVKDRFIVIGDACEFVEFPHRGSHGHVGSVGAGGQGFSNCVTKRGSPG